MLGQRKRRVILTDLDGCALNPLPQAREDSRHAYTLAPRFLSFLKSIVKREETGYISISSGSARTGAGNDAFSSEYRHHVGLSSKTGSASAVFANSDIARCSGLAGLFSSESETSLKSAVGDDSALIDRVLFRDLQRCEGRISRIGHDGEPLHYDAQLVPALEKSTGQYDVKKMEALSKEYREAKTPYDSLECKTNLLLFQIYYQAYQAKKNGDSEVIIDFIDDRDDILSSLSMFFREKPELIPTGVTLNLHQCNPRNDRFSRFPEIKGSGVDFHQLEEEYFDLIGEAIHKQTIKCLSKPYAKTLSLEEIKIATEMDFQSKIESDIGKVMREREREEKASFLEFKSKDKTKQRETKITSLRSAVNQVFESQDRTSFDSPLLIRILSHERDSIWQHCSFFKTIHKTGSYRVYLKCKALISDFQEEQDATKRSTIQNETLNLISDYEHGTDSRPEAGVSYPRPAGRAL